MQKKTETAAVIFDMDGVLIDSEPLHYESTILYLNDPLGLAYDEEENREFLGRSDEYMFRKLKERYNLPASVPEMIQRRRDIYLKLLVGNVRLIPEVTELIRWLKSHGFLLGLASYSLQKIIDVVVDEGGVRQYFTVIQSGEHLANCKPHPEIFLVTAEKLKVEPQLCTVIEDTAVGIRAAKTAGMYSIAYDALNAPSQEFDEADLVVRSFAELQNHEVFR